MKNKIKIIGLSIGIALVQYWTSYFAYITVPDESPIIKVILNLNTNSWHILIISYKLIDILSHNQFPLSFQ